MMAISLCKSISSALALEVASSFSASQLLFASLCSGFLLTCSHRSQMVFSCSLWVHFPQTCLKHSELLPSSFINRFSYQLIFSFCFFPQMVQLVTSGVKHPEALPAFGILRATEEVLPPKSVTVSRLEVLGCLPLGS